MSFCFECGEKISEEDVFCPFCGITLKTVASLQQEEKDISSDKIIAGGDFNAADFDPPVEKVTDVETPPVDSEQSVSFEESDSSDTKPEEISKVKSPEFAETKSANSSATAAREAEEPLEENELPQTPADRVSDVETAQPKQPVPQGTVPEDVTETPASESDAELQDSEIIENFGVVTPEELPFEKEVAPPDEPEIVESAGDDSEIAETEHTAVTEEETEAASPTIAYTDDDVEDIAKNKIYPERELKSLIEEETPAETVGETPLSADEPETAIAQDEEKIEIPEIPLEEPESRDATFDSVKIMQDEDSYFDDSSKESAAEGSYTTPNFGENDTGGKKGIKLKTLDEGIILNNRYEIIRKIGGGGMGAVYLATDRNLGETLRAVKEMVQSYIEESQQEKAIDDFKREATILSNLDHPSIPTIYDYFFDDREDRFYLVMKYISGGDLASRLRSASEGRIDEISVTEWAIQIADVLDYLHNRQPAIVYRDLKPSNIMIDGNSGRVMLIDFGIARSINKKEEKGVTAVGTMGYAPPELFSGNVEPRSDIYSLGSTMFHLLTGADPQSNPLLIFDFQKHPMPRQINPQLSDQMQKILMRAVEYNSTNRFSSAAELRDLLKEHLENLKGGKTSYGVSLSPVSVGLENQKVFCGFCGQQIVATDMFCAFCGSKQPLAQQGVHSSEYVTPLMTARLVILGTNDLETPAFSLEKDDNLVGRRDPISQIFPEIDLSKYDPQTKISRRHARIRREGGKFVMEDLGSSNGTLIVPVVGDAFRLRPHEPHYLTSGENIKVGDTTLHFVIE